MYINETTLRNAVRQLYGTAGHLLKIWFTLKHMGLAEDASPVDIDTSNSTPSLNRLFSCGHPRHEYFIPFAHTKRYASMKSDASRSIIQTTIQRWASSGSVVTCDPKAYLDCENSTDGLKVCTGRHYPMGLGNGESGFALENNTRVSIPITAFAIWYGRQTEIPNEAEPAKHLIESMLNDLNISPIEQGLIFIDDQIPIQLQDLALREDEIFTICQPYMTDNQEQVSIVVQEEFTKYARRVRSMVTNLELPVWMRSSPENEVRELIRIGQKSILIFGPPRTGKTRLIDTIIPRNDQTRCTIQIHDGWGYDHLVQGFKPNDHGEWRWESGPLKKAIDEGKKFIILEEINRTAISQALGEVFSLIETTYRGEANGITLRSGDRFWIPEDVVFLMTMNTIDKSTEDIDDALLGRVAAVEFFPRSEDLTAMLTSKAIAEPMRDRLAQLFVAILDIYPLGHGYFDGITNQYDNRAILQYYKTRIRPVLKNFLGDLKMEELIKIDNLVNELFGTV